MPTTITSLSVDPYVRPVTGIDSFTRINTPIPAHTIVFNWGGEDVDAAASGAHDQLLLATFDLPRNYAYILQDASVQITLAAQAAAGTFTWDANADCNIQDNAGTGDDFQFSYATLESSGIIGDGNLLAGALRIYTLRGYVPKLVTIPVPNRDARVGFSIYNPTVGGPACKTSGMFSLLAYEREQAQMYQVATPHLER